MAASYTCDGCGGNVAKPVVVGFVLKRDYCEECSKNARLFLESENAEREHICARFQEVRKLLIGVHSKDGKFRLPDVP